MNGSLPVSTTRLFLAFLGELIATSSWRVGLALAIMVLVGFGEGLGLLLLVPLLSLVGLDVAQGAVGQVSTTVLSAFAAIGLRPSLPLVLVLFSLVMTVQALLYRAQSIINRRVEYTFTVDLRRRLYAALIRSQWPFFSRQRLSDRAHALTAEIDRVGMATQFLLTLLATGAVSVMYLLMAFRLSAAMTSLVLVCAGALVALLAPQIRKARATGEGVTRSVSAFYAGVLDHLGGMKTAKSYGAEPRTITIFAGLTSSVSERMIAATVNYGNVKCWFDVGAVVILSAIVYVAFELLRLPTAAILLLILIFGRTMPRFAAMQQNFQHFLNALPAFAAVRSLEARAREAEESHPANQRPLRLEREIRLSGVTFSYGAAPLFTGLDLTIHAGRTTAIVGPSGAGKSTIADLVMGLVRPVEGHVLVDGDALMPDHLEAWRDRIGYVAQDTFLFNDSVRANLLWAKPDASDAELKGVLDGAAASFVWQLPEGLDTMLGDRGSRLSGGERQRLALARALLRARTLLILDEATSSVDAEHEQRILQAVSALHGRITILVITHRLATVRDADVIHVLDGGRLVESGTWDALADRPGGRLRMLIDSQSRSPQSV